MYETLGKVTIALTVLTTIVRLTTLDQRGVHALAPCPPKVSGLLAGGATEEGTFVEVTDEGVLVDVHIVADSGTNMLKLGEALQTRITRAIEEMVGMPVAAVNVYIDSVALLPEAAA
ncbi:MAG TPA: Asp23/Gls24 family envelope stress response protein [Anaerolineae bacterium]